MGIYLFNRDTLIDVLQKTDYRDFGKEVFPASIRSRHVQVHLFDGYWEDIGTIKSFYEANLELATPDAAVRSGLGRGADLLAGPVPAARRGSTGPRSAAAWWPTAAMIEEGAVIENSVIGLRCRIGRNVVIRNSIVMGNDFYEVARAMPPATRPTALPPLGIGEGTHIEGAIIDKNCRIGRNVRIVNAQGVESHRGDPLRHDPRRDLRRPEGRGLARRLEPVTGVRRAEHSCLPRTCPFAEGRQGSLGSRLARFDFGNLFIRQPIQLVDRLVDPAVDNRLSSRRRGLLGGRRDPQASLDRRHLLGEFRQPVMAGPIG